MLDFLQQKTLKKLKLTSNIFVLHLEINDIAVEKTIKRHRQTHS